MVETTPDWVKEIYSRMKLNLLTVRKRLDRPLTLTEKILFSHVSDPLSQEFKPGEAYLKLGIDRVIMQDATAQMAILQFIESGKKSVAIPTTIHCDHLIRAHAGAKTDTEHARSENKEVYEFLRSAAEKFGMGFWGPGSGIIHQVVLENYAFPGGLMIGSDSHTPNMGGLGMIAIGVGGADAVDAMAGLAWEILQPKVVGVHLTGKMTGWTAPKDIILSVASKLTVKGGTNRVIEYFGEGARLISATGKATITNMGAEIGATTSIFPFDDQMISYLKATNRGEIAELARQHHELLIADARVEENPNDYFDEVIELNLSELEPLINGPFTPDRARTVSSFKSEAELSDIPLEISAVMIGSCTNSSYEDLSRAADIARQASAHGAKVKVPLMVNPGSALIFATIERDGILASLKDIGAQVLANACGPCIGQWQRDDKKNGERNTIVNSYNRNFPGRNDNNPETCAFVASPEVALAYALAGRIDIDPLHDELSGANNSTYRLTPPQPASAIPEKGFLISKLGYEAPSLHPETVELLVPVHSERLQVLEPFEPLVEPQFAHMPVLIKTKGKTTTDQISPAGSWLRFRGNLERISENLLIGAVNAWTGERGTTSNVFSGEQALTPATVAKSYKAKDKRWVIIGDENYGEGSSREHAAMSPRFLGAAAVIARSFARIHESNLKKQGILPLTFKNSSDYDKIREGDLVTLEYLHELDTVRSINMMVLHKDGTSEVVILNHNMTMEQLGWFHAGSALNMLRKQGQSVVAD